MKLLVVCVIVLATALLIEVESTSVGRPKRLVYYPPGTNPSAVSGFRPGFISVGQLLFGGGTIGLRPIIYGSGTTTTTTPNTTTTTNPTTTTSPTTTTTTTVPTTTTTRSVTITSQPTTITENTQTTRITETTSTTTAGAQFSFG